MLSEIRDVYIEEIRLYTQIMTILENIDVDNIDAKRYQIELDNTNYLLNKIKTLNERAEQLKTIYITKNCINDFTGPYIREIETNESFSGFKETVDALSQLILNTKRLNDEIHISVSNRLNLFNALRKSNRSKPISKEFIFPESKK